jgi:hypothetical protein
LIVTDLRGRRQRRRMNMKLGLASFALAAALPIAGCVIIVDDDGAPPPERFGPDCDCPHECINPMNETCWHDEGGCAHDDADGDGLDDADEQDLGTDPENADTDGDGRGDGDEVAAGTDPLDCTC